MRAGIILMISGLLVGSSVLWAQVDPLATCETRTLYRHLKVLAQQQLLFGHQNTTYEGIGWKDRTGEFQQSDVWESVGDFPAVHGFDFIDAPDGYHLLTEHVKQAYLRGGIITFSDHFDNPATGGDSWDTGGSAVSAILDPDSEARLIYQAHLDEVADFFNSLTIDSTIIPVIFRPFHENTGSWFWWGANLCEAEEFRQIWQFTVDYLRNEKGVHNLLYAYSPSRPATSGGYGARYPGDGYVDIIGFDYYAADYFGEGLLAQCQFAVSFAYAHDKVAALTEFGYRNGLHHAVAPNWFTSEFLDLIRQDPIASHLAWALTWRNDHPGHHWVPLPGDITHGSFLALYEDSFTAFARDLPADLYNCQAIIPLPQKPDFITGDAVLFPNPAVGLLNIQVATGYEPPFDIRFTDALGRIVLKIETYEHITQILPLDLPSGLYFVHIQSQRQQVFTGQLAVK